MNFSINEITGLISEQKVEYLFTSWGWGLGKDRLDFGYDWIVAPDFEKFKGARFLVQVKGTSKKTKGKIVASVSKRRLREYAENPHPVFILRVCADGDVYWLHAQEWVKKNFKKISGSGNAGLRFDENLKLSNKEIFISYLERIMDPEHKKRGSLIDFSSRRKIYLNSLDPAMKVDIDLVDGKEIYKISAISDERSSAPTLLIFPSANPENLDILKNSIDFGIPASVDVDELKIQGSPIFDALGISGSLKGKISINSNASSSGFLYLYPGLKHSITVQELKIPAVLHSGPKGFFVENHEQESAISVEVKVSDEGLGKVNCTAKIGIDNKKLYSRPVKMWDEFRFAYEWARQSIEKDGFRISLSFRGIESPLAHAQDNSNLEMFFRCCLLFGKLHALARYFCSDFSIPEDHVYTVSEQNEINLIFSILKGDECEVEIEEIIISGAKEFDLNIKNGLYAETSIDFRLAENSLGSVPVKIFFFKYSVEKHKDENKYRVFRGACGSAKMSYLEDRNCPVVVPTLLQKISP